MRDCDDIDIELARMGKATAGILPRADFSERVMQAIEAERRPLWHRAMGRAGQRLLPVAALAAAIAVVWAAHYESALEDLLATSYETTELEW